MKLTASTGLMDSQSFKTGPALKVLVDAIRRQETGRGRCCQQGSRESIRGYALKPQS